MVAVELEVLAKKFDRFGWERDRGSAAHDRMLVDWMNALQDFPLTEVQAACRAAVLSNPNKMPNEGHIRAEIIKARAKAVQSLPRPEPEPSARRGDPANADQIMRDIGFKPRRFGASSQGAAE
ncbi:hypothetical protein [Phaeobacter gallaeciensis]|uniref:Uncharacterized protein n=2 Tax=Phaeobacter gallaeciensis TaxID=60890 RepID=A0AAC9ZA81_9RHOB|nr:hypothetical protein [Phaeobacter gallaeciensis]AHD10020.1 hypothetical protein Gal_02273 [Phaeobacter gallaeciensis DSM 26640]ATE93284.1 hypothetical protein PhaeoP11_02264 [Phaeobacter gallaeciensis]ATE96895.1 hypothetical protein PhaeoP73_01583 [Phaeobacter gallaeciensis]ATF01948.1 hypothetical protein PhaeoP75_02313 [Phaeobacter gallaeciensis]ATF06328.1 hypothetical protein PhaeoP63_02262 [Phaeobacter gallaeciensis]